MEAVPSSYFRCIKFPHEGKLVTIDQLSFYKTLNESGTSVPFVDNSTPACENMGVGLYSSMMGSFNIAAPILSVKSFPIYAITNVAQDQDFLERSFKTTYLLDPWPLPKSVTLMTKERTKGITSPLFAIEVAYRIVQEQSTDECSSHLVEEERNIYPLPMLSICSSSGSDPLDTELFTDETIMEVMCPVEKPWAISHRSSFLPTPDHSEMLDLELAMRKKCDWFRNPFLTKPVFVEGNLSNISTTILINISSNPKVTKNLLIGANCSPEEIQVYTTLFKEYQSIFAWTYEEMLGIDPWIVEHKIKTYPNVKPIRQKLRVVNPRKAPTIKAEIEKLLKVNFIYPVPLTEWVSNPVAMNKKDGKIHVCTDFRDPNKACPKDKYPTLFIDQILDDCFGDEIFSFMDGFSRYNQI